MNGTLDRTGTEFRIIAFFGKIAHGGRRDLKLNPVSTQHFLYAPYLQTYDLLDFLLIKRSEHNRFINTVQKFRTDGLLEHVQHLHLGFLRNLETVFLRHFREILADHSGSHIRGHDDYGVLEIDKTTLVVGQPAVVQHLQKDVEHIRMRFLDLIEQHH